MSACLVFIKSRRTVGLTDIQLAGKVFATLGHVDYFSNTV